LDAVGADNDEHDIRQLGDLALLGNIAELAVAVERLRSTSEAVPAIRAMQRRLLQVAPARARVERGERTGAVMASLGKSLFWKDKPLVEKILARWSAHELATISTRLGMLERKLMFSEIPEREALGEELLAIARKARSAPGP
jgi:DNA polymerase-3 subunit delta